jgi:hypothetical protein
MATHRPDHHHADLDPAADDQQVTGYRLYLDDQPLGSGFTLINTANTTTTQTYRITGLPPHPLHRLAAGRRRRRTLDRLQPHHHRTS